MDLHKIHKKPWWLWLIVVLSIAAVGVSAYALMHSRQIKNDFSIRGNYDERFPNVDEASLNPAQAKIVSILRAEFYAKPAGTKYSQGVAEPWCADFVSWVMDQAGMPLTNPNSGGWRIPGTMTLRDYFKQKGNWHAYGTGYVPKAGDIAIYDGNGPNGQHTNFVVQYTGGNIVTVGGNEAGAIHVQQQPLNDDLKVIGFGAL